MLEEILKMQVQQWEELSHPSLLERFVLRNGKAWTPVPYSGTMGEKKQCFQNAFQKMDSNLRYCEGFGYRDIMPIHHAWLVDRQGRVVDPTWDDPEDCQYYGCVFPEGVVRSETLRRGMYGLFDTGMGLNTEFMFERDPDLRDIVRPILKERLTL